MIKAKLSFPDGTSIEHDVTNTSKVYRKRQGKTRADELTITGEMNNPHDYMEVSRLKECIYLSLVPSLNPRKRRILIARNLYDVLTQDNYIPEGWEVLDA